MKNVLTVALFALVLGACGPQCQIQTSALEREISSHLVQQAEQMYGVGSFSIEKLMLIQSKDDPQSYTANLQSTNHMLGTTHSEIGYVTVTDFDDQCNYIWTIEF